MTLSADLAAMGKGVVACADLAGWAGAKHFQIGYTGDDADPRWYAHAQYRGARLTAEDHATPSDAANALAWQLLAGARCRCGRRVTLNYRAGACLWRLVEDRWEPGCDVPPITMPAGMRGDVAAMRTAIQRRR